MTSAILDIVMEKVSVAEALEARRRQRLRVLAERVCRCKRCAHWLPRDEQDEEHRDAR